jgi:NAD(P)-dependent dehydrogenase (short-subunit alcohol dehydrogenase family)
MSKVSAPRVNIHAEPAYPVWFSREDLAVFTRASGDQNPLHVSELYARPTPYGELLVYGYLGVLACYSRVQMAEGWSLTAFSADFLRPMVMGVCYHVETPTFEQSETGGKWTVSLFDGSIPVVTLLVYAAPSTLAASAGPVPSAPCFRKGGAVSRPLEAIVPGLETSGRYACDPAGLRELCNRWGVEPAVASLFCFSSYVVGTELPGESNLCGKVDLRLERPVKSPTVIGYHAKVVTVDRRFNKVRVDVALSAADGCLATGRYWSFLCAQLEPEPPASKDDTRPEALAGRSAAIIGASRGLGSALRSALMVRGASVYSLSRSTLQPGDVDALQGDATDPESLKSLRQRIVSKYGNLDFLICNAFPPILPLHIELNAASRISGYINEAVSTALLPMCLLLDLLDQSSGCLVLISSTAIDRPVKESPHYAAAKAAVEMLARVAAMQYPRIRTLIVRPPKLLTALTNTPVGRLGAGSPRHFAAGVAARLETALELEAGTTTVLD